MCSRKVWMRPFSLLEVTVTPNQALSNGVEKTMSPGLFVKNKFFACRLIVKPADRGNFDRKDDPYEKKNIYGCCGCFGRCIFDRLRKLGIYDRIFCDSILCGVLRGSFCRIGNR